MKRRSYERKALSLLLSLVLILSMNMTVFASEPAEGANIGSKAESGMQSTEHTGDKAKATENTGANEPAAAGTEKTAGVKPVEDSTEEGAAGAKPVEDGTETGAAGAKPVEGGTETGAAGAKPVEGSTEEGAAGAKPVEGGTEIGAAGAVTGTDDSEAGISDAEGENAYGASRKSRARSTAAAAVAVVNGTEYATLGEVVTAVEEAAKAGQAVSVKLLQGIHLEQNIVIASGMNVTIDLNGQQVTVSYDASAERSLYAIDNYGTFTLEDTAGSGTITARGIKNVSNGVMTVNGGTIISCDKNGGAAIWNEGELTVNGGEFQSIHVGTPSDAVGVGCLNNKGKALITGGKFSGANRRTYAIISAGELEITPEEGKEVIVFGAHGALAVDSGTAVVNGGSYKSSDYYGLYVSNDGLGKDPMKAAVTVNGGEFTGKSYSVWVGSDYNNPVNSTVEITGGTFHQPLNAQEVARDKAIQISGGVFENWAPEDKYLAEDYVKVDCGDGSYTVGKPEPVAAIDSETYTTLTKAVAAAKSGDIITLLKDADTESVVIRNSLTLDLGGHVLGIVNSEEESKNRTYGLGIADGELRIVNGSILDKRTTAIENSNFIAIMASGASAGVVTENVKVQAYCPKMSRNPYNYLIYAGNGASVTINNGTVLEDFMYPDNSAVYDTYGVVGVAVNGSAKSTKLTVNGGSIQVRAFAIGGNGSADNTEITIHGGTIASASTAIYHPQVGNLTIDGDTTLITGLNGIQYCGAGNLKIAGGTIKATGAYTEFPSKPASQGDGSTDDGAALSIISRGGGYQNGSERMNVEITGGTLISENNAAISVYRLQNINGWVTNDSTKLDNFLEKLKISGGVFKGGDEKGALEIDGKAADEKAVAVSGGAFSHRVKEAYCADNYDPTGAILVDNMYTVAIKEDQAVAMIGTVGYETVTAALQAVKYSASNEIKLVKDVAESIVIPADVTATLDLNGRTLTGTTDANGKMADVITNHGTLVIKDSSNSGTGTVVGGSDQGQANNAGRGGIAVNNRPGGSCIIESGTIRRGDEKTFGNYTILNEGTMEIKGGTITNNSKTSSMICNGRSEAGTMIISGGLISQDSMTAVKNDTGTLTIKDGAHIVSKNNQALQNWSTANMEGGLLEGIVSVYTWSSGDTNTSAVLNITGGTVKGKKIMACNYQGTAVNAPVVNISGNAVIQASLETMDGSNVTSDKTKAAINVSGGKFSEAVKTEHCASGYIPTGAIVDGMYTVELEKSNPSEPSKPSEPSNPAKPSTPGNSTSGSSQSSSSSSHTQQKVNAAKTGDALADQAVIWSAFVILAMAAMGAGLVKRRSQKK